MCKRRSQNKKAFRKQKSGSVSLSGSVSKTSFWSLQHETPSKIIDTKNSYIVSSINQNIAFSSSVFDSDSDSDPDPDFIVAIACYWGWLWSMATSHSLLIITNLATYALIRWTFKIHPCSRNWKDPFRFIRRVNKFRTLKWSSTLIRPLPVYLAGESV